MEKQIAVNGLAELDAAAAQLLAYAGDAHIFIFKGEMGAGKTTLIKSLALAMGVQETVSSPTFSIVNEYEGAEGIIFHFDFYRIKNLQEAYDIGYEEYFYSGNVCLIEWPEKIEELLPENYIEVRISAVSEHQRQIGLSKISG